MTSSQPAWKAHSKLVEEPVLKVFNSLTKTKVPFESARGRSISWYNCGPTVYDASHMGHARNYVAQDVIRRILKDYFKYDVKFVMNITDIDDKIIITSRQNHLFKNLVAQTDSLTPDLLQKTQDAWTSFYTSKFAPILHPTELPVLGSELASWPDIVAKWAADRGWVKSLMEKEEKADLYFKTLTSSAAALTSARESISKNQTSKESALALLTASKDPLSLALDKAEGKNISDPLISRELAAHNEQAFFESMDSLNVLRPDVTTRVSEYVPEIVRFVEKIIENKFAYVDSEGGVWFDVAAFDGRKSGSGTEEFEHVYAKLAPGSKSNQKLIDEGEGALTSSFQKRSPNDFALWKFSKPGEPAWDSPWGKGRPGWHIECSVMASEILGSHMDIHSGGVDLKFPHHDNELAQSEAYHNCADWVSYFFHTGHLHIEGLKMSKSLKNFITIDDALKTITARQLRLYFLGTNWSSNLDYKASGIITVKGQEATFNNFFSLVKALISSEKSSAGDGNHYFNAKEVELDAKLDSAQLNFRVALSDSFNTPAALEVLFSLVSDANVYVKSAQKVNLELLRRLTSWIAESLRLFGLGEGPDPYSWGQKEEAGTSSANREEVLVPVVKTVSDLRDEVRKIAIAGASQARGFQDILALLDRFRDYDMAEHGIALEDQPDGKALVKLVPAATLIEAREAKASAAAKKLADAAARKEAEQKKLLEKMEKAKILAREMFKPPHIPEGTYSEWDDEGKPTKDGEGVDLSKSKLKGIAKDYQKQQKANEEYAVWSKQQS